MHSELIDRMVGETKPQNEYKGSLLISSNLDLTHYQHKVGNKTITHQNSGEIPAVRDNGPPLQRAL